MIYVFIVLIVIYMGIYLCCIEGDDHLLTVFGRVIFAPAKYAWIILIFIVDKMEDLIKKALFRK